MYEGIRSYNALRPESSASITVPIMSVRSLDILRREQERLLAQYRARRRTAEQVVQLPTAGPAAVVTSYGRVTSVVSSDPTYGAHLVVAPQQFTGMPPSISDSSAASLRCYAAPNRTVSDYSVNEYVKVLAAKGAFIADKSA